MDRSSFDIKRKRYFHERHQQWRKTKRLARTLNISQKEAHQLIDRALRDWYIENGLYIPQQRKVSMSLRGNLPLHNVMYCAEVRARFEEEPRPCPFCGSKNIALWLGPNPHMMCAQCGAAGPIVSLGDDNDAKHLRALWLWNSRGG